jgi:hypothetical protein
MARLWWDGFEYQDVNVLKFLYADIGGYSSFIGTGGAYTGEYALVLQDARTLSLVLESAKKELYVKFHYRPNDVTSITGAILGFYKGTTCLGWLQQVNRDLKFFSGTGTGTQLGSTASNALSAQPTDYNLIEVRLLLDDSDGYAQVRVSETLVIDFGPGDSKPGADTDIDRINLGTVGGSSPNDGARLDDFIIDDAAWIGNKRVYKIQINGVGSNAEWDPSTGANYACVDEIPYSDADFVSTNVVNEIDTYACSNLPGDATSAKGLMVIARAAEEGTATPQNVKIACLTGGEYHYGDDFAPPSGSPAFFKKLWVVNPKTSADWLVSEINAVELGVKAVA